MLLSRTKLKVLLVFVVTCAFGIKVGSAQSSNSACSASAGANASSCQTSDDIATLSEWLTVQDSSIETSGVANVTRGEDGELHFTANYNVTKTTIVRCPDIGNVEGLTQLQLVELMTEPCRYDRFTRPSLAGAGCPAGQSACPVNITARISVFSMKILDEKDLILQSYGLIQLRYEDKRLAFSSYAPHLSLPIIIDSEVMDRLWLPYLALSNQQNFSAAAEVNRNGKIVSISPDGTILISTRFQADMDCILSYQKFPFDEQLCAATFQSWIYDTDEVMLYWFEQSPIIFYPATNLTTYDIEDYWSSASVVSTNTSDFQFAAFTGNYSTLTFTVYLSRDLSIYIVTYFVPSMMIVANSWIAFWLQPDQTPARSNFGTSTLLSFITLSITQQSNVPNPFYMRIAAVWFLSCFVFIFSSLMEFAFVNVVWRRTRIVVLKKLNLGYMLKLTSRPRQNKPLPVAHDCDSCTKYIGSAEAKRHKISTMTVASIEDNTAVGNDDVDAITTDRSADANTSDGSSNDSKLIIMSPHEAALWIDRKARFIFPCAFVLFNAVFWTVVLCM